MVISTTGLWLDPWKPLYKGAEDGDEHHRKVQIAQEKENTNLLIQDQPGGSCTIIAGGCRIQLALYSLPG